MAKLSQSNMWLGIILGTLAIAGVTSHASGDVSGVRYDDDSFRIEAESASFAIRQAQASLGEFTQALLAQETGHGQFSIQIKQNIPDRDAYTWIQHVTYENGRFSGIMTNKGDRMAHGLRADELLLIDPADVTDWSYVENQTIKGSYMVRLVRSRMTVDEREQHDAEIYVQNGAYY